MTEDDIRTRLTEVDLKMFSVKKRTKNTLPQFILLPIGGVAQWLKRLFSNHMEPGSNPW